MAHGFGPAPGDESDTGADPVVPDPGPRWGPRRSGRAGRCRPPPAEPGLVALPRHPAPDRAAYLGRDRLGPAVTRPRLPTTTGGPDRPVADRADRPAGPLPLLAPGAAGGRRRLAGRPDRRGGRRPAGRCAGAPGRPVGGRRAWWPWRQSAARWRVAFWPFLGRTGEQWLPLAARWAWATASGGARQHAAGTGRRTSGGGRSVVAVGRPPGGPGGAARQPMGQTVGLRRRDSWRRCPSDRPRRPPRSACSSTVRPAPPPRCWLCRATASPCWARPTRTRGSPPGPVSSPPWPGKAQTSTGSSGSSPACPTTARRCATTGPATPCSAPTPRPGGPTGRWSTSRRRPPVGTGCCSALSVHTSRSSRAIRVGRSRTHRHRRRADPGGRRPPPGAGRRRDLGGGRARPRGPGPGDRRLVCAGRCDPAVACTGRVRRVPTAVHRGPGPWPWSHSWDAVHTDATWHATYWIAEWPRVDVTPDFLGPVLFSSLAARW